MAYLGASPPAVFSAPNKDNFSGNGSTKTFTLSKSAGGANAIQVFVDNVRQEPTTAYSVNDKTLNFTSAPASGTDNIYVINASAISRDYRLSSHHQKLLHRCMLEYKTYQQ